MTNYDALAGGPNIAAAELQVPRLADFASYIRPTEIPVITDDEMLHTAEQTGNWDSMETYEYASAESISMRALVRRFEHSYFRNKPSDELMGSPGKFIEAIWQSERQTPNIGEYAQYLGKQGLLNDREVGIATTVADMEPASSGSIQTMRTKGTSLDRRDEVLAAMDEDARHDFERTHRKLEYLINLAPDALGTGDVAVIAKRADDYASKALRAGTDTRARDQAFDLLMEARGVSAEDIKLAHSAAERDPAFQYRLLGLSPEMAQHMAEHPDPGFSLRGLQGVNSMLRDALTGNLNTQLAVRQFLGAENLYELLGYQARADRLAESDSITTKNQVAAYTRAVEHGDEATVERIEQASAAARAADDGPRNVFELPLFSDEERTRFESLAAFAIHEPALHGSIAYFTEGAMISFYRKWIEAQAPGIYR